MRNVFSMMSQLQLMAGNYFVLFVVLSMIEFYSLYVALCIKNYYMRVF